MNKHYVYLSCTALVTALVACTPPAKDVPGLSSGIDAALAGHYGQSLYHEQLAEQSLEKANNVLEHWKNDQYWNIDEKQKGIDAAQDAAKHRLASEKELCQWLTEVHGKNHHQHEASHHSAAYFKTGSAVPYKVDNHNIWILGKYLQSHPDATAEVLAYTDTVGTSNNNQILSERRAATVSKMLVEQGANIEQLHIKSLGEGGGPDNTPNQKYRTVDITTDHPDYIDCPNLK